MMFEAINYREHQWHSKVRNQNVEDIRISRMIKGQGMKTAVLLGNRDIYCRMYRNLGEAILGFSRNIHEYFGGSRLVMTFFWLMVCFAPFNLFFFGNQVQMITFAVLVLANRLFVALASRQNVILAMLLHPFQMIGFSCIVVYNIFRGFTKNTEWKGRKIGF
jgi:chlorobactene glucosyltransferase